MTYIKPKSKKFIGVSCEIVNDRLCYIGTSAGLSLFNPNGISSLAAVQFLYDLGELRNRREYRSAVFVWYAAARDVEYILRDCVDSQKDKLFSVHHIEREINRLTDERDEAKRILAGGKWKDGPLADALNTQGGADARTFCQAIVKLNEARLRELRTGACSQFSVEVRQGKSFRVWLDDHAAERSTRGVLIYDIFSFFGVPLFEATATHLGLRLPELSRSVADDIDLFNQSIYQTYIKANELETATIADLGAYIDSTFKAAGVNLRHYYGPGSAASALLNRWEVKHRLRRFNDYNSPRKLLNAINGAYHGGRMETFTLGAIAQPITVLDINSAYAFAMLQCPDISGARLVWDDASAAMFLGNADWYRWNLYHARYEWPDGAQIGALPHRTQKGVTVYRKSGRGWYWGFELQAAALMYPGAIEITGGYTWRDAAPLPAGLTAAVIEFYEKRFTATGEQRKLLKHALAALWGKFAQARGQSPYSSRVWAGMITSVIRARLLEAISRTDPAYIVSLNVDAVHIRHNAPVLLTAAMQLTGEALGAWKASHYSSGLYLAPGIYRLTGDQDKSATRGFSELDFENALDQLNATGSAYLKQKFFAGYRLHTIAPGRYEYLATHDDQLQLNPSGMAQRQYRTGEIKDWRVDQCGSDIHTYDNGRDSAPPREWLTHSGEFDSKLDLVQARRW